MDNDMNDNKRMFNPRKLTVRALLKEIDAEADDYIRRINNPSGRYFASTYTMVSLLKELERRHPLSMATRRHGQKLYDRVKDACMKRNNWREDGWLADDIRRAFDLRSGRSLAQLAGREFAPVYPIFDGEYDSGDDWFKGQTLKMYRTLEVTNEPLPAGTYYIEYVIYDMFMRPMFLDWARMDWDGQTATFPDADSWQGEVELKVPETYW